MKNRWDTSVLKCILGILESFQGMSFQCLTNQALCCSFWRMQNIGSYKRMQKWEINIKRMKTMSLFFLNIYFHFFVKMKLKNLYSMLCNSFNEKLWSSNWKYNKLTSPNNKIKLIFLQQNVYHVIYSTSCMINGSYIKVHFYVQKKISPAQLCNLLIQQSSIFRFYQGTKYVIF